VEAAVQCKRCHPLVYLETY